MSKTPGVTLCVPEIVAVVRALVAVGEARHQAPGVVLVRRYLLDLSARERRELRRAGVLVDTGRRDVWCFRLG